MTFDRHPHRAGRAELAASGAVLPTSALMLRNAVKPESVEVRGDLQGPQLEDLIRELYREGCLTNDQMRVLSRLLDTAPLEAAE